MGKGEVRGGGGIDGMFLGGLDGLFLVDKTGSWYKSGNLRAILSHVVGAAAMIGVFSTACWNLISTQTQIEFNAKSGSI